MQAERAELYEETGQLQHHMEDMGREKRRLEQELEWLSQKSLGYEAEARTLQEQNEFLSGKVRGHAHYLHRLQSRLMESLQWNIACTSSCKIVVSDISSVLQ